MSLSPSPTRVTPSRMGAGPLQDVSQRPEDVSLSRRHPRPFQNRHLVSLAENCPFRYTSNHGKKRLEMEAGHAAASPSRRSCLVFPLFNPPSFPLFNLPPSLPFSSSPFSIPTGFPWRPSPPPRPRPQSHTASPRATACLVSASQPRPTAQPPRPNPHTCIPVRK